MAAVASKAFKHMLNQTTSAVSQTSQVAVNFINHNHAHFPISTQMQVQSHCHSQSQSHIAMQMQMQMQMQMMSIHNNDIEHENEMNQFHYPPKIEQTCALIKPESVQLGNHNAIIDRIKNEGFNIVEIEKMELTDEKAKQFYADHNEKPFFNDLLNYMTSGPIYALNLEKRNGIKSWRSLMGPTDANHARTVAPDSLRAQFGTSKEMNAVHGSDSKANAKRELDIMFS